MNVVQETMLVAGHDVRRSLTSARGIVLLVLSMMGALMTSAIMSAARALGSLIGTAANLQEREAKLVWEMALTKQWGGDVELAKHLAQAPVLLYFNTFAGARFAAALVALVGFDAIAGDLQYGAIRYVTVRAGRWSYYAGKLVGVVLVASTMMFFAHAFIWVVSVAREGTPFADVLRWGPYLWLIDVAMIVAWSGFAQLIGSQFRSPVLALLVTFAAFFGIWIVSWIAGHWDATRWLTYVYPCELDKWLFSPQVWRASVGALGCIAIAAASSALGAWTFARRDV